MSAEIVREDSDWDELAEEADEILDGTLSDAEIEEAAAREDVAAHAELVDEDRHPETGEALDGS